MLESLTIVHRGGIILYQYVSQPSIINTVTDGVAHTRRSINEHLISKILLLEQQRGEQRGEQQQHGGYSRGSSENDDNSTNNNDQNAKSFHIADGLTYVWLNGYDILRDEDNDKSTTNNNKYYDDDDDIVSRTTTTRRTRGRRSCAAAAAAGDVVDSSSLRFYKDLYCVALYPDILFEGPRQYLKSWSNNLIYTALKEYILYHQSMTVTTKQMTTTTMTTTNKKKNDDNNNNKSNSSTGNDNDDDDQRDDNNNNNNNNNSAIDQSHDDGGGEKKNEQHQLQQFELIRPDPKPFDKIFRILLQQSKTQKQQQQTTTTTTTSSPHHQKQTTTATLAKQGTTTTIASSKSSSRSSNENKKSSSGGGKAKTHWGEAKVTERAMAELDMSKKKDNNGDDNDNSNNNAVTSGAGGGGGAVDMDSSEDEEKLLERQLQEARATYLPSANEVLQQQQMELQQEENVMTDSWTSHITNLFDKKWMKTGTVLTDDDLDQPIQKMEQHLKSKNVSNDIAQQLCMSCRKKLRGKTLNSLYRIQTAIIQSLEPVLERILYNDIDLIRNVIRKRGDYDQGSFFGVGSSSFSSSTFFGNPGSSSGGVGDTQHTNPITGTTTNIIPGVKRPPYVIVVMGINGIGKTTTIAKLAYYFVQNQCKPLLVAGDTFRSGAIEQLNIHGKCLNVPIYNEGYSKDPSLVTKSAIRYATENGHDVVLVDTAGRMQNNIPLMKAITKLVTENKPDFICLVCEALVGHDGIHQYTMFQKAVASTSTSNNNTNNNTINGFILTKYDTVSDKVGAVLTLTYQTKTPILFLGIGQKYNHLQKISVKSVVQNLLT